MILKSFVKIKETRNLKKFPVYILVSIQNRPNRRDNTYLPVKKLDVGQRTEWLDSYTVG